MTASTHCTNKAAPPCGSANAALAAHQALRLLLDGGAVVYNVHGHRRGGPIVVCSIPAAHKLLVMSLQGVAWKAAAICVLHCAVDACQIVEVLQQSSRVIQARSRPGGRSCSKQGQVRAQC